MKNIVFKVICLSFIGNFLSMMFVSTVLFRLGYSAAFVSSMMAFTILPNLLLGPVIGRKVDVGNKKKMHFWLNVGLIVIASLIGLIAFKLPVSSGKIILPVIFITYNLLSSPLMTLHYQYLVPSIGESEDLSYIEWERYESIALFLSSFIGFVLIKYNFQEWLIIFDVLSFAACAYLVDRNFPEIKNEMVETASEESVYESANLKNKLRYLFPDKINFSILGMALVGQLVFVFCVDSHFNFNLGALLFKSFHFKAEYIPLAMGIFSLINMAGASMYKKHLQEIDMLFLHKKLYFVLAMGLGLVFVGLHYSANLGLIAIAVLFLGLALMQIVEPIWSSTNSVLLRSQINDGRYGEFNGYFRIGRSVFTAAGMSLYGIAQTNGLLSKLAIVQIIFILFPAALSQIKFNKSL
jgi:hypothetical protein